jgi:beta-RFAP synthase
MRTIQITAASRLHFGLVAPSEGHQRRFGGVGVMVQPPSVCLTATEADRFVAEGPAADRVGDSAARWASSRRDRTLPSCRIVVNSLPRTHAGLGVGTQLALSVGRILNEWVGEPPSAPAELARIVGRGHRSAVGTYGFFQGGLIAERGKSADDTVAPLLARLELPAEWRWLLVCPRGSGGLHGIAEQRAFAEMREPSRDLAEQLLAEMHDRLLPAARYRAFAEFSASLYRFGYQSGSMFACVQGSAYNGPRLQQIVAAIRALGIEGVGQSSWGPTIFALCPHELAAQELAKRIRPSALDSDLTIAATCNHGACIS